MKRRRRGAALSEFDGFDDILDDLMKLAGMLLERPQGMALSQVPLRPAKEEPDEVIEGEDRFTYILDAPGYTGEQLKVIVREKEIDVTGPDFTRRRQLPSEVIPNTVSKDYRNGVLCVRVSKA